MLRLKNIHKNYLVDKKPFPALKNINLTFSDKGFVSILGPSGCGKTTLLNLIGGLDQYTSGDLIINNKSTKQFTDRDWDAYRNRRVGFVFQSYNLVPHLTVLGNVDVSMKLSGLNRYERERKALQALKKVGLKNVAYKKPNQLSGGQMQRVAIARSLVNDPEIILADEPTGALDSVTSVQVMKILKKVSSSHLVIMVTHNEELAKEYSTRIIKLKDGRVISDSNPPKSNKVVNDEALEQEKNKHTHMSFFTALTSSAKSLLTKKGRTVMTAIAASFGIIGVSLVLALSNGFSNYVHNMEVMTASSVPITISPFVTTSIEIDTKDWKPWPDTPEIIPYNDNISSITTTHHNRIRPEYVQYCNELVTKKLASSVLENHEGLDFNVLTKRGTTDNVFKVDQYNSAGTTGSLISGLVGLPSSIFHELYGNKEYINSLYDVVYGRYPQSSDEVVLACDRYNHIPINTLYNLGFVEDTTSLDHIAFDSIVDFTKTKFKIFTPDNIYINRQLSEEKTSYIIDKYNIFNTPTATEQKQIASYTDITAKGHETELQELYNGNKSFKELKVVGIIRPNHDSQINLMPGSICYTSELKNEMVAELEKSEYDTYRKDAFNNWIFPQFTDKEWEVVIGRIIYAIASQNTAGLSTIVNEYFDFYDLSNNNQPSQYGLNLYLLNNLKFSNKIAEGLKFVNLFDIDYPDPDTYTNINELFAYLSGYSTITSIMIFPQDLSAKHQIFAHLDAFNTDKAEDDKIYYSDIASTITDAVGTMIDIISIVLIIFSSISLLVSCVMTGVITYTSVLERTKEIGILRAIGARKKDVGRLFEAEAVIIGGVAGIFGVLVTFIVQFPISFALINNFPEQNIGMICNLSPWHALLLVFVSILLTFVAGFIPARKASKKDPVVALRTE